MSESWSPEAWNKTSWKNSWDSPKASSWDSPKQSGSSSSWANPLGRDTHYEQNVGSRIPHEFQQTTTFLDERQVLNMQLNRYVESTPWSRKQQLAGKAMEEVTLADVVYRGWNDQSLRYLSTGRFIGVITTRSVSESVFCSRILQSLKESRIDIDQLCEHMHRNSGNQSAPSKFEKSIDLVNPLVPSIVKHIETLSPAIAPDASSRIQELEQQIEQMKQSAAPKRSLDSQTALPFKKAKTADQMEQPEEIENEPEENAWLHPSSRYIESNCPISEKEADYKKWLAGIRKKLSRVQQNALTAHLDAVQKQYEAFTTVEKPSLPDLAAKWGLPVTMAASMPEKFLLGVISVASYATA